MRPETVMHSIRIEQLNPKRPASGIVIVLPEYVPFPLGNRDAPWLLFGRVMIIDRPEGTAILVRRNAGVFVHEGLNALLGEWLYREIFEVAPYGEARTISVENNIYQDVIDLLRRAARLSGKAHA